MNLNLPKWANTLILLAVLLFIGLLIPKTLVLSEGELFNEELDFQSNLLQGLFFIGSIGFVLIYVVFLGWKRNDKYGDNLGFQGDGSLTEIGKWWHKFDIIQRTIISTISIGLIFFTATLLRLGTFTGFTFLPQQFTPTKSILFSTLLTPISENIFLVFLIAFTTLIMTIVAVKYDLSVGSYKTYLFSAVFLISGLFAVLWHSTAYSGSDLALPIVFGFWAIGGLISIYLDDMIPFLAMHMFNNFFIDFTRLFTSDTALYSVSFFIFGIPALIWIGLYGFKFTPRKK